MDTYNEWANVPGTLKTRTGWKKSGRRVKRGSKPSAEKVGGYGPYDLYHLDDTEENTLSEAQLAAIAKAKAASEAKRTCKGCGYVAPLHGYSFTVRGGYCDECRRLRKRKADRQAAVDWARDVLSLDVLILDTETTSLHGEVIELAMIKPDGTVVYNGRFKPQEAVSAGAFEVHGLTNEMLENEPLWSDEWPKIWELIQAADGLVIYNSNFDLERIRYTCELYGVEYGRFNVTCAMYKYAEFCGDWSSYHKDYKWQPLPGGNHSALGDCEATLKLLKEMAKDEPQ